MAQAAPTAAQTWCAAALWDMDGTLLDSEPIYFAAFQHAAAELGRGELYTWDFHVAHVNGRPEAACLRNFIVELAVDVEPERVLELRNEHALKHFPHCKVLPGVEAALETFNSRGLPLAIATSSARKGTTFSVKTDSKRSLLAHFNEVLCVDDDAMAGKRGKPSPDIYHTAAALLGVPIERCVVFEDSLAGIRAGVASGAYVVAIPDVRTRAEALAEGAHLVLDSLVGVDWDALLGGVERPDGLASPSRQDLPPSD